MVDIKAEVKVDSIIDLVEVDFEVDIVEDVVTSTIVVDLIITTEIEEVDLVEIVVESGSWPITSIVSVRNLAIRKENAVA